MKPLVQVAPIVLAFGWMLSLPAEGRTDGCAAPMTMRQLQRMNACELAELYAKADIGSMPSGCVRGRVLILTGNHLPRASARTNNVVWKGKCFDPDGCFTNRWLGFNALTSQARPGPSWEDGRPSLVMDYPPGTPILGNVRDEIREVAPGLWLGRLYETCPCPRFLGFFALEAPPACCVRR
jgi:hypothetical protein